MPVFPRDLLPIRDSVSEAWDWQAEPLYGRGRIVEVHETLSEPVFSGSYRFERRPEIVQPIVDLWDAVRGPAEPWWFWTYLRRAWSGVLGGVGDGASRVFAVPLRDLEHVSTTVSVDGGDLDPGDWELGNGDGLLNDDVGRGYIKINTVSPPADAALITVTTASSRRLVAVRFVRGPLVVRHPGYRRYAVEVAVKECVSPEAIYGPGVEGALPLLTISGYIGDKGGATPDVLLGGAPGDPVYTEIDGTYSFEVVAGWSGTIEPTKGGYNFDPPSRNYSDVQADQVDQDYEALA